MKGCWYSLPTLTVLNGKVERGEILSHSVGAALAGKPLGAMQRAFGKSGPPGLKQRRCLFETLLVPRPLAMPKQLRHPGCSPKVSNPPGDPE